MRYILVLPCFFMLSSHCFAQIKYDYIWLSGRPDGDPSSTTGLNIMDFNDSQLSIEKYFKGGDFYVTNASICDTNGNLLFYSNGCSVFNADHEIMENGSGLNPGIVYLNGFCPDVGNTAPRGAIILPLPGNTYKYYVFHESFVSGESGIYSIYIGVLYYSLIDLSMNNTLGKVVEKNQAVIADTLSSDLHAVKHANGEDWWILVSRRHENKYYKVLLTAEGVSGISEQKIGLDPDPWFSGGGQASFSPDGTKYARYTKGDQVFLFDFDRSTGELSNFQHLYADTTEGFWGSLSFSSNSRFLYVSTQLKLWQFDMQASDIQASKVLIDQYDGYTRYGLAATFYLMQLAPDCKIYMVSRNGIDVLHVIHNPNEQGVACDFRQHDIILPVTPASSVPNFPNYRLDTPYPVCDSTIQYITSSVQVAPPMQEALVYPNPATESLTLELPGPLPAAATWTLHAATGQPVRRAVLAAGQTKLSIPLDGLPPGLYFWKAASQGRSVGEGKVVILK